MIQRVAGSEWWVSGVGTCASSSLEKFAGGMIEKSLITVSTKIWFVNLEVFVDHGCPVLECVETRGKWCACTWLF